MKSILLEGGQGSWFMIIGIIVIFAVLMIPTLIRNRKANAKRQETMKQLKAGDSIITTAGVFGKIVSMRETTIGRVFVIETGDENYKSYQEIHADAIMGLDTKRDIILDAEGNDITFAKEHAEAEEEKKEEVVEDKKVVEQPKKEKTTTKSASRNRKKKSENK